MAQVYSPEQARRQARVSAKLLGSWQRKNLVPSDVPLTASDLAMIRGLAGLHRAGLQGSRLQDCLDWIASEFGTMDVVKNARVIHRGRRSFLRLPGQEVELWSGQLRLRFDAPEALRFDSLDAEEETRRRRLEAEQWFQRGLDLEQQGAAVDEIVSAYRKAAELDEKSAGAYVNLGTIYFNARMWKEAERHYQKALEADNTYPLAHFNVANLYDERGETELALQHYEEALRLKPAYADAHYNLALLHQSRGQTMKALKHWRVYLELDPASSWALIARREMRKLMDSSLIDGAKSGASGTRRGRGANAG